MLHGSLSNPPFKKIMSCSYLTSSILSLSLSLTHPPFPMAAFAGGSVGFTDRTQIFSLQSWHGASMWWGYCEYLNLHRLHRIRIFISLSWLFSHSWPNLLCRETNYSLPPCAGDLKIWLPYFPVVKIHTLRFWDCSLDISNIHLS